MLKLLNISLCFLMLACASSKPTEGYFTADFIQKGRIMFRQSMEASPIIWNNRLHYVVSNRVRGHSVEIYDSETLQMVAERQSPLYLLSALVHNNELYLFGTIDSKTIIMTKSSDLVNFTAPVVVIPDVQGREYYNSSVSVTDNGFVMAYETCEQNMVCFSARFAVSQDLVNWQEVGMIFKPDVYAACPTIRYHNGYYYVFYLEFQKHFFTAVSRSSDLINWEDSKQAVLSSLGAEEGENNSDMDLIEFNGKVYINFAIGNQQTFKPEWLEIKQATFDGTLNQFLERFF